MIVDTILALMGFSDPATLTAVLVAGAGAFLIVFLNRRGLITWVGICLIVIICGAILGADLSESVGVTTDTLPDYDLLVMAVVVAASLLRPRTAFVVAGITSVLICLDFFLQPHAPDLQRDIASYPSLLASYVTLLARPIALQVIVAMVALARWRPIIYPQARGQERCFRYARACQSVYHRMRRPVHAVLLFIGLSFP